jgi:hypothetical protein
VGCCTWTLARICPSDVTPTELGRTAEPNLKGNGSPDLGRARLRALAKYGLPYEARAWGLAKIVEGFCEVGPYARLSRAPKGILRQGFRCAVRLASAKYGLPYEARACEGRSMGRAGFEPAKA